jgi:hypothetical protein
MPTDLRAFVWLTRAIVVVLTIAAPLPAIPAIALWALMPHLVDALAHRDPEPGWHTTADALRRATRRQP